MSPDKEASMSETEWEVAAPSGGYSLVVVRGDFKPGYVVRNDDAQRLCDELNRLATAEHRLRLIRRFAQVGDTENLKAAIWNGDSKLPVRSKESEPAPSSGGSSEQCAAKWMGYHCYHDAGHEGRHHAAFGPADGWETSEFRSKEAEA